MEYDKLELIEHKAEKLLQDLKSDATTAAYSNALYIVIILSLSCIGYLYIYNVDNILIYIMALVLSLLAYRYIISKAAKEVELNSNYKSNIASEKPVYVKSILNFLASKINLQMSRIKALRIVFTMMFPFLLMMIRQIALGPIPKSSYLINFILAVLLGSTFWYFFFRKDIDEKEQDYWEVINLSKTIKS